MPASLARPLSPHGMGRTKAVPALKNSLPPPSFPPPPHSPVSHKRLGHGGASKVKTTNAVFSIHEDNRPVSPFKIQKGVR